MKNYYQILGLPSTATHEEIKRAFRRQAMALHPDRNPGLIAAEDIFRQCVEAYETLSDIHQRAAYDLRVLGIRPVAFDQGLTADDLARATTESVLDTPADDVLEELVVGNEPPPDTTLRTLFLDLERTENFILLRDGKEAFFTKQYMKASVLFRRAEECNPRNILVLYFQGRTCDALGQLSAAEKLFRRALRLGESRLPPNHCPGVRKSLLNIYRRRGKTLRARWLERENQMLASLDMDEADQTVASVNRALARLGTERLARQVHKQISA